MGPSAENRIARYASIQSMSEIGFGSLIHAFRLPLGGHLLSLNQLLCLGFATRPTVPDSEQKITPKNTRRMAIRTTWAISTIVALLKVLSPAGARISPMIGIFSQGVLFSMGFFLAGANFFGLLVGATLLSVCPFFQSLFTAYLFFGSPFFEAIQALWLKLSEQLGWDPEWGWHFIFWIVFAKIVFAWGIAIFAWTARPSFEQKYLEQVERFWKQASPRASEQSQIKTTTLASAAKGAFLDLLHPLFLISLALCLGFVFFKPDAGASVLQYTAQTLGFSYLLFFAIRAFPTQKVETWAKRHPNFHRVFESIRRQY